VQNDILSRMMHEGVLQKKGEVVATNSPAMDIQVQANPFQ
jgi:threonine synthase